MPSVESDIESFSNQLISRKGREEIRGGDSEREKKREKEKSVDTSGHFV
jgi:hypothetical protein